VVLLDEIEKASPVLLNLFLQAFDEGWLTDGRGKRVYLSDSIVIMTSNAGSEHFSKLKNSLGFRSGNVAVAQVQSEIHRELERRFSPEFRNRIDQVVVFEPLTRDQVRAIAMKYLDEITRTLSRAEKCLTVEPEVIDALVGEGHSMANGARFLKRVIDERIKLPLSQQWKEGSAFRASMEDGRIVVEPDTARVAKLTA
jgi:ATP-dependent Clp protease ATP-binding subunit ClpA